MLSLVEKTEVFRLGLLIGYFKKTEVINWADQAISELNISDIPNGIFEISLSMKKKSDDIINLLKEISQENHIDKATKILLGLFSTHLKNNKKEISEVVMFLYRLAWERNKEDDLFYELNGLESVYDAAVNGYGSVEGASNDVVDFLARYEPYAKFFKKYLLFTKGRKS